MSMRLRAGTHPVVNITTTYLVENFTKQNDQTLQELWAVSGFDPPERPDFDYAFSFMEFEQGYFIWKWRWKIWTFNMMDFWLDSYHASSRSPAMSGLTLNERFEAFYFNGTMYRPRWSKREMGVMKSGGFEDVEVVFVGVQIT